MRRFRRTRPTSGRQDAALPFAHYRPKTQVFYQNRRAGIKRGRLLQPDCPANLLHRRGGSRASPFRALREDVLEVVGVGVRLREPRTEDEDAGREPERERREKGPKRTAEAASILPISSRDASLAGNANERTNLPHAFRFASAILRRRRSEPPIGREILEIPRSRTHLPSLPDTEDSLHGISRETLGCLSIVML